MCTGIRSSPHVAAEGVGLPEEHGTRNRHGDGGGSGRRRPQLLSESRIYGALMHSRC